MIGELTNIFFEPDGYVPPTDVNSDVITLEASPVVVDILTDLKDSDS